MNETRDEIGLLLEIGSLSADRAIERDIRAAVDRAIESAVLAERERCAKIAAEAHGYADDLYRSVGMQTEGEAIARRIREGK